MKEVIDIQTWNRKQIYEHFVQLANPFFGVVIPFDVTRAYQFSKENNISFFGKYLHDCMRAINAVDNLRYRIVDGEVVDFKTIHASPTILRDDKTFGFSYIKFDKELKEFLKNFEAEKQRVQNSNELYPPINGDDCIHCSALPWFHFSGHSEPTSGKLESIPELSFSKTEEKDGKLIMNVAINVNHALVDGYHIGLFSEKFQDFLNE